MFWEEIWGKKSEFLSKNFQFLVVKFWIYLNMRVFVMFLFSPEICLQKWSVSISFYYIMILDVCSHLLIKLTFCWFVLLEVWFRFQVSFFSTSTVLSNRDRYPYFLRTIPSDVNQAQAMVELVKLFNWTYVSVIYEESSYGIQVRYINACMY